MSTRKKNIALVLSSGGARGFAHIGAIKVLEAHGFHITSVAGTSMGALVGGVYATGELAKLETWLCSLDVREVLRLTDFSISTRGLVKGRRVMKKMQEIIPDRNIEDLSVPFCAVATDIVQGKEFAFTSGNLYDAIRASISIPTVFQPFGFNDTYFVDGGVLNPVPIRHVKRTKGDMLVVVYANAMRSGEDNTEISSSESPMRSQRHDKATPPEKKSQEEEQTPAFLRQLKKLQTKLSNLIPQSSSDEIGMFNLTNKSISLMLHRIAALTLARHEVDLLIDIPLEQYGTYDFYKAKEIIQYGEHAAGLAIDEYGKR